MFFYTYVLKSLRDSKLYVGWTNDIKNRLKEHNSGKVVSTKSRIPFKLVYYEACLSKSMAVDRERQSKTGFGRAYLKSRLDI